MNPAAVATDFAAAEAQARAADMNEANAAAQVTAAESEHAVVAEAVALLTAAADTQREAVRKNIEGVVTAALQAVFGPSFALELQVEIKRGVVSMEPFVLYTNPARRVPVTEIGGGVADVIAFAFRVAVLCLRRPRLRPVLFADEPFKHVSADYLPHVAAMLRELADRTGLQLIIVSHEPEIAEQADTLFRVTMRNGNSVVEIAS